MSFISNPESEMSSTQNRFAMLSMDDDSSDAEIQKESLVEQPPVMVPLPVEQPRPDVTRKWTLQDGKPERTREWNLDTEKTKGSGKRGPFSRYAFRDDTHGPRIRPPRTYAFRDDSPPPESLKPVSPVTPKYPTVVTPPLVDVSKEEDFPKLSDYNRPQTPPYPPDDGYYPTLAERVRIAIQRSDEDSARMAYEQTEKKVINMDTVIPMPTRLSKNLVIE